MTFVNAFRRVALSNVSSLLTPTAVGDGMATYIQLPPSHNVGRFHTMQQVPFASGGMLRATLAISADEAVRGTTRTILSGGGRPVEVQVPPITPIPATQVRCRMPAGPPTTAQSPSAATISPSTSGQRASNNITKPLIAVNCDIIKSQFSMEGNFA